MLSRRLLRAIVMQALYAFYQSENDNIDEAEKAITDRINKIYTLFIYQISFLLEIVKFARKRIEEGKSKYIATAEDLVPNTRFIDNPLINQLYNNKQYQEGLNSFKISWVDEKELIRKIYNSIKNSNDYIKYIDSEAEYETDKKFIIKIFRKFIVKNYNLQSLYEEKSIYWADDYDLVNNEIIKTLTNLTEKTDGLTELYKLKDTYREDMEFIFELFRKTIIHSKAYEKLISEIIKNWEIERVATIDVLLMKMALCEILNFPEMPVKVSLNEYIEIAKIYSTPKSNTFINGVLDKLVEGFKKENKIIKTGRGIIE